MSSHDTHPTSYAARPPSLSAGAHEMRDGYVAQDAPQPSPDQEPYLTPYLGLRARLSQIWINRWTVLLILVLIRTLIACANLDSDIGKAKLQALSACSGVESTGSAMASMPHYLSQGVNELAAHGVEKAVNGLMDMLTLTVTGVEEIVVFAINLLTSTYLCLITMAVTGSLHVSISLIEDVTGFLNKTLGEIGKDIENGVSAFQSDLNKLSSFLDNVPSFFGSSATIPTLNLTGELSALNHLQLPSGLDADLSKLNASIPSFTQVQNLVDNAIREPFGLVKKIIRESTGNYTIDSSLFPVPEKKQLTFCSDNNGINDFFNGLADVTNVARKVFIGVILVLAVLVCAPMAYREIRGWRTMKERAQMIHVHAYDPVDVVYIASRPYTASAGIAAAKPFKSSRGKVLVRWVFAYATTTPALYVLSLGIAGLLASLCQYILLKAIEKEVPALSNEVEAFAEKVIHSLEDASVQWAYGTNSMINMTNHKINQDVFGWVNVTTHGVNHTLNVFVDEMIDALNATFGGTILYGPITDVFNCLIGLKIAGIEKGLTWVSDNAYVDFPMFPDNIYSSGAANSIKSSVPDQHLLANPGSDATNQISAAVVSLMQKLESAVRSEATISACIVGIWFIILLIGLVRATMLSFGHVECREQGIEIHHLAPADPFPDEHRQDYNANPETVREEPKSDESRAPSYDRAVTTDASNNSSNYYKGAAYTLDPRPFPTVHVTSPPDDGQGLAPTNEKVGYAGARPVDTATQRPRQFRKSSCADLTQTTPAVGVARTGTFEKMGY